MTARERVARALRIDDLREQARRARICGDREEARELETLAAELERAPVKALELQGA